jgi:hypothetical protein
MTEILSAWNGAVEASLSSRHGRLLSLGISIILLSPSHLASVTLHRPYRQRSRLVTGSGWSGPDTTR